MSSRQNPCWIIEIDSGQNKAIWKEGKKILDNSHQNIADSRNTFKDEQVVLYINSTHSFIDKCIPCLTLSIKQSLIN